MIVKQQPSVVVVVDSKKCTHGQSRSRYIQVCDRYVHRDSLERCNLAPISNAHTLCDDTCTILYKCAMEAVRASFRQLLYLFKGTVCMRRAEPSRRCTILSLAQ